MRERLLILSLLLYDFIQAIIVMIVKKSEYILLSHDLKLVFYKTLCCSLLSVIKDAKFHHQSIYEENIYLYDYRR